MALVWNTRDEGMPWVARLSEEALGRESIERNDVAAPLGESGLFGAVEQASFRFSQRLDCAGCSTSSSPAATAP